MKAIRQLLQCQRELNINVGHTCLDKCTCELGNE